jgi:hypothetical protein
MVSIGQAFFYKTLLLLEENIRILVFYVNEMLIIVGKGYALQNFWMLCYKEETNGTTTSPVKSCPKMQIEKC